MTKRWKVITSQQQFFHGSPVNVFSVIERISGCFLIGWGDHYSHLLGIGARYVYEVWNIRGGQAVAGLVSINNFSNIKEERINKLSSLKLGLILHFLLKRSPWNEKKNKIYFLSSYSITVWCTLYNECLVCVYILGVLSQIIIYIGILNINTSPYIKTITASLVLQLLKHWYKEYHEEFHCSSYTSVMLEPFVW